MVCTKCEKEMMIAKLHGDAVGTPVYLSTKKKGIFDNEKRSGVNCYVCPKCGYIELQAINPEKLV